MRSRFWKLLSRVQTLMREDGQDMVEYALLIALIAFAITSGEKILAEDINSAFTKIGAALTIA